MATKPIEVKLELKPRTNGYELNDLGRIAYDAYCNERQWKAFDGTQLKPWPQVDAGIQQAWVQGALAVINRVYMAMTEDVK